MCLTTKGAPPATPRKNREPVQYWRDIARISPPLDTSLELEAQGRTPSIAKQGWLHRRRPSPFEVIFRTRSLRSCLHLSPSQSVATSRPCASNLKLMASFVELGVVWNETATTHQMSRQRVLLKANGWQVLQPSVQGISQTR